MTRTLKTLWAQEKVNIIYTSRNTRPTDVTEIEYRDYRNIYEGADI